MEKNIEIKPFYVGQEIVATKDHNQADIKKGNEFIVKSIQKSCCGYLVDIGKKGSGFMQCSICSKQWRDYSSIWWFACQMFAPKYKLGEFVSMKEVVQLETVCAN